MLLIISKILLFISIFFIVRIFIIKILQIILIKKLDEK